MRVRVPSARRMHEAAHMPPGIRIFMTVNPPLEAGKPVIFERYVPAARVPSVYNTRGRLFSQIITNAYTNSV